MEISEMLLRLRHGGKIVSTGDLQVVEVAVARNSDQLYVDDDGFGYVYIHPGVPYHYMAKRVDDIDFGQQEPQEARAASPLESAALNVAQRFSGAHAVIDPASVLLWGQLVVSLLEMFRQCRANRDGSDAQQLIDAANRRRVVHVVRARDAAREVFGRFNRREIVRAADAALDAAAESSPEEIEAIYADMESR